MTIYGKTSVANNFEIPTIRQIAERLYTSLDANIDGADSRLRRSTLNGLALAAAGAFYLMYAFIRFLSRQIFPDTATKQNLDRQARIHGLDRRPATAAYGKIILISVSGANNSLSYGIPLEGRTASGQRIRTVGNHVLRNTQTPYEREVRTINVGKDANITGGTPITITRPTFARALQSSIIHADGLTGGKDEETDAELTERLLEHIRTPPQGGAETDYLRWAREVTGVTRTWVQSDSATGTVTVLIVSDPENDAATTPAPSAELRTAVTNAINAVRPIAVRLAVPAPTITALNPAIRITPDTTAIRDAIQKAIVQFLKREAGPGRIIRRSRLSEAISLATGETSHILQAPASDITAATTQIHYIGTISWQ